MRMIRALGAVVLAAPMLAGAHATAQEPAAASAPAEAGPNNNPGFLQVYDANVENLPTTDEASPQECAGDWHDLMYYMRTQELKPDIYLVQQISNQAQLDLLLDRMRSHFGEKYAGVLAEPDPAPGGGVCVNYKKHQTNGVIWRTGRLDLVKSQSPDNRWQAQNWTGTECVNNDQSRTKGIKALLYDRVSGNTVTAASFHWPTVSHGGAECARSNIGELSNELTEDGYDSDGRFGGTDLYVAGGDTNAHDVKDGGWSPWYAAANGDLPGSVLGFRDAVYADCQTADVPGDCRKARWTLQTQSNRRVDYVLGRKPGGGMPKMTGVVVPTFEEGNAADKQLTGDDSPLVYSDHRAVGARVHY
ncbi:hypothetical protein [Streptomyces niveus]|uniref:Endonuclease n=1 Tax=Streptomyces niveus TaxID=193462 RepID=A0ABZ2A8P3_STRNV|nr:hypothetical protein [Streptomyces niveus]